MNNFQKIFDFQVVRIDFDRYLSLSDKYNLDWFDEEISKFENTLEGKRLDIDYWIGITSENIDNNWNYIGKPKKDGKSGKAIITSSDWEELNSPPSLFEYIVISVLMCSLYFLNKEFDGMLVSHPPLVTKGCIFDFTTIHKADRRILVSNPNLCSICKGRLIDLDGIIKKSVSAKIDLYEGISKILDRKWMGGLEERDSPIYNLKKNYGYNIDRNSGFLKTPLERFHDSIIDHLPEWTIGTLVSGIAAGLLIILGIPH